MSRLKTAAKTVGLGALAFVLAMGVGATGIPNTFVLALIVSVGLCPLLLGFVGARGLGLGPVATLVGINFLPVLMALDQRFHLQEPARFDWLLISMGVAWVGWRLGRGKARRRDVRKPDMAE
jgi:hypothetical protein